MMIKPCPFCSGEGKLWSDGPEQWFVQCRRCCSRSGYYANKDAVLAAWNRRVDHVGWISVNERLPKDQQSVLVYSTIGYVSVRRFMQDNDSTPWVAPYGDIITHWMPLPPRPEPSQ